MQLREKLGRLIFKKSFFPRLVKVVLVASITDTVLNVISIWINHLGELEDLLPNLFIDTFLGTFLFYFFF